jgi:hypothetical protein
VNGIALEAYLARLYTDATTREKFLADPGHEARAAGLSDTEVVALCNIDKAGLRMAAASYANKRAQHRRPRRKFLDAFLQLWVRR